MQTWQSLDAQLVMNNAYETIKLVVDYQSAPLEIGVESEGEELYHGTLSKMTQNVEKVPSYADICENYLQMLESTQYMPLALREFDVPALLSIDGFSKSKRILVFMRLEDIEMLYLLYKSTKEAHFDEKETDTRKVRYSTLHQGLYNMNRIKLEQVTNEAPGILQCVCYNYCELELFNLQVFRHLNRRIEICLTSQAHYEKGWVIVHRLTKVNSIEHAHLLLLRSTGDNTIVGAHLLNKFGFAIVIDDAKVEVMLFFTEAHGKRFMRSCKREIDE